MQYVPVTKQIQLMQKTVGQHKKDEKKRGQILKTAAISNQKNWHRAENILKNENIFEQSVCLKIIQIFQWSMLDNSNLKIIFKL